jgi:DNA-binding winged helix-turn-helix (wHTH) protein
MSQPAEHMPVDLAREPDFLLGATRVRPASCEVFVEGRAETFEPPVLQALIALAQRRGTVVSREELGARCGSGRAAGDDVLNRCIARLRRLADDTGAFTIETIARAGYRLTTEPPVLTANQERLRFFAKHYLSVILAALLAVMAAAVVGGYLGTRNAASMPAAGANAQR